VGLIEVNGAYKPNPLAENIPNLPGGHEYYLRQVPGKAKEWVKVFLLGNYGTIADGRPVYPEWNDEIHCRPVKPIRSYPSPSRFRLRSDAGLRHLPSLILEASF
jgi:hypothetical protein